MAGDEAEKPLPPEALLFVGLQGLVAGQAERRHPAGGRVGNPYGKPDRRRSDPDTVRAAIWAWGFAGAPSRCKPGQAQSSIENDPRGEVWPPLHRAVLHYCDGVFKAGEIGGMIGRPAGAVRNQKARLGKGKAE